MSSGLVLIYDVRNGLCLAIKTEEQNLLTPWQQTRGLRGRDQESKAPQDGPIQNEEATESTGVVYMT